MASETERSTFLTPEQEKIAEEVIFLLWDRNGERPGDLYLLASIASFCHSRIYNNANECLEVSAFAASEVSHNLAEALRTPLGESEGSVLGRRRLVAADEASLIARQQEAK